MENRHNGVQIKIICLWICCFVILILGGICTFILDQEVSDSLIDTYALQQYDSVERIVAHMKEMYESKQPKDIDESFTSYIQEEKSSANAYWFLYTEDKILFEKDAMQTKLRDGKKLSEILNEWSQNGGTNIDQLSLMFQGKLRYVECRKEDGKETESISAVPFIVNDKTYIVGNAASRSTIEKLGNYQSKRIIIFLSAAAAGITICIAALFIYRSMREEKQYIEDYEEIKHDYNAQFIRMEQELKERRRQVKDFQLMDSLSLFYNREYFYTLLLNMKRQNLKSLGMIVIELGSMHSYIDKYGLDFEQEVLTSLRDCLEYSIQEECITARVRDNRIVITIISDDYRQMSDECNALEQEIKALQLPVKATIYSIIQMPNENAMDMYQRIDQIISIH